MKGIGSRGHSGGASPGHGDKCQERGGGQRGTVQAEGLGYYPGHVGPLEGLDAQA